MSETLFAGTTSKTTHFCITIFQVDNAVLRALHRPGQADGPVGGHGQGGQQQAGEFKRHTEVEGGESEGGGENDAAQEDQNDVGDRAGRNG